MINPNSELFNFNTTEITIISPPQLREKHSFTSSKRTASDSNQLFATQKTHFYLYLHQLTHAIMNLALPVMVGRFDLSVFALWISGGVASRFFERSRRR